MARVTDYPTNAAATALAQSGALISRRTGSATLAPYVVTWQPAPVAWQPAGLIWYAIPYADWQDCPDKWDDCNTRWDETASTETRAFIRVSRTLYNTPTGAYKASAERMRACATSWAGLTPTQRTDWNNKAAALRAHAYEPVIDPRTGAPRFGKERRFTGFTLYVADAAGTGNTSPPTPSDPTRTDEPQMTELLIEDTYEQRMLATLAATDGNLTIAMYQVSPNWSGPGLAASPLFAALSAQTTRRANCRMILGTPGAATNLAALNNDAAALLTATGWQVRRVPTYPVLHAKLWLIERGYVYAGSHNLSNRATTSNIEAGILTTAASVVNDTRTFLERIWDAAL